MFLKKPGQMAWADVRLRGDIRYLPRFLRLSGKGVLRAVDRRVKVIAVA